jgi:hypothetical protein
MKHLAFKEIVKNLAGLGNIFRKMPTWAESIAIPIAILA